MPRKNALCFFSKLPALFRQAKTQTISLRLFMAVLTVLLSINRPAFTQTNTFPSTGNAGVGTTSPTAPLTVVETSSGAIRVNGASGVNSGNADLSLHNNATTTSNWNVSAATLGTGFPSGAVGIAFYDLVNSLFPFAVETGAPSGSMFTNSLGAVGIGTTAPTTTLQVDPNASGQLLQIGPDYNGGTSYNTGDKKVVISTWSGSPQLQLSVNNVGNFTHAVSTGGVYSIVDNSSNTYFGLANGKVGIATTSPSYTLQVNGSVAGSSAYVNTSDVRLKRDVKPLNYGLRAVMALHPISFNWKNQDQQWQKQHQVGLSAQDVERVVPEVVVTANDDMKTKSIAYGSLVPVLVKAIQQQQKEIEALNREVNGLKTAGGSLIAKNKLP